MKFRFHISVTTVLSAISLLYSDSTCAQQTPHNIASYQIDVTLDTKEKRLIGDETITFRNVSDRSLETLCLHLYPNAFRNEQTTFMRECPRWFREQVARRKKWGWVRIDSLGIVGGQDLTDSIVIDETVLKIPLPQPLPPSEEIVLRIDFTVQLPRVIARMGYTGDHYSIGQWFPKMCAIRPNGSWVDHQFHCNSEFFADFGTYDVSMTVPDEYVVGATGHLQEEVSLDQGQKTLRYHAQAIHDFYWEADPNFIQTSETIDEIEVTFLCRPQHRRKIPRVMKAARTALHYYGQWYGPYPYGKLVISDSEIGPGGGGMEYPMIVAIELNSLLPQSIRLEEAIVIHEIGHQWWYGVVATNEFEEAWLDEGINTYSTRKVLEAVYGKKDNFINIFGLTISEQQYERGSYLMEPDADPIVRDAWEYRDFFSYTSTVYGKASLMLETLERYLGEDVTGEILKTYYERFSFKHPTTDDFRAISEEVSGRDLDWFFEPWLYGTGVCDYAVTRIESEKIEADADTADVQAERYRTAVTVERTGEVVMPVDVLIELKSGQTIAREWDGVDRWITFELETESEIRSAVVDPESKIALDANTNNNGMTTSPQGLALFKIGSQLLFAWETLIQWVTGL
jgi:hypothetical protein